MTRKSRKKKNKGDQSIKQDATMENGKNQFSTPNNEKGHSRLASNTQHALRETNQLPEASRQQLTSEITEGNASIDTA